MHLNNWLLGFVFLISFVNLNSQNLDLGKVSVVELQEKIHSIDTSAVAAVLSNKAKTSFKYNIKSGFSINTEFQIRIKIYKKEGLSWANFEVPYYVGYENSNDDSVRFSDAVTYNLENGAVVRTKLNSEGSFKTNKNKYWNVASIVMPNVKVGSIIEFKYVLKSEDIVKFPHFNFQYEIPVNYSEYVTEIPGFFVYKAIVNGFLKAKTEQRVSNGSLHYANKNDITKSNFINFQQLISKYSAFNIPALKYEPYVDNLENYRFSIQHELEKTQFNQEPVKDYATTWEGVAKTIFENKDFGKELEKGVYFLDDLKTILKKEDNSTATELEKLLIIFKFVQQKMNWNKENRYYTDKGVKEAYVNKIGNSAEINFILINMLKMAGINANPVLVSTKDHGIPVYPNRTVFNYVIAAAEIGGKQILLDATSKFTAPDVLPLNVLNWTGRLIRKDGTSAEINLVPEMPSRKNCTLLFVVDAKGKIDGKFRVQNTNSEAFIFREKFSGTNKESYVEKLENDLNGIEISDYSIENENTDLSQPVAEIFTFATTNHCEIIAGKMFINPMLFFAMSRNPFVQEQRQMPVYFGYSKQNKYHISVEIPAGYVVESLPKVMRISTEGKEVMFSINILNEGNKIQFVISEEINGAIFHAEFYSKLKEFYQKIIENQNEKIVLKRV
jgi:hypothetical protein